MANSKFDYIYGSAAKKLDYIEYENLGKKKTVKKVVKKAKKNEKIKAKYIVYVTCFFTMLMIITYRYNVISESNLVLQNLKKDSNRVQSNLLSTQMNIEQNTDMSKIEAYAKQQLGMQKPDKNQVVYIDTSANAEVVRESKVSFIDDIISKIQEYINKVNQ